MSSYFLRVQVSGNALTFYMQRGALYDAQPEGLKGTVNGAAGGGFQSTPLDMCIAWVVTAAPGTTPVIRLIYNRSRLSWTQTVNGNGVVYLPLDPQARAARLVVGNPTPHPTAITGVSFAPGGWAGGNYSYLSPISTGVSNWDGWATAGASACIFTSNVVNDATVSTLTASFDHSELRSLWQTYQAEHTFNSGIATSVELLFSMGIKFFSQPDYSNGIAVNFSAAVNVNFSWELIR
jgi:hypothetical protein